MLCPKPRDPDSGIVVEVAGRKAWVCNECKAEFYGVQGRRHLGSAPPFVSLEQDARPIDDPSGAPAMVAEKHGMRLSAEGRDWTLHKN